MIFRGQISWAILSFLLMPFGAQAQDLAFDETGPTAVDALSADLLQDDFLTPTYSLPAEPVSVQVPDQEPIQSVPAEVDVLTEIFGPDALRVESSVPPPKKTTQIFTPTKQGVVNTSGTLLTPLPELPLPMVAEEESEIEAYTPYIHQEVYAEQALKAMQVHKETDFTMPSEIRISFYPGQSFVGPNAVKWVKAFALKVLADPRYSLDIRASSENWPLQSQRVGLLIQMILEQGVSRHQIRVFQSDRDVNSLLLGYTRTDRMNQSQVEKGRRKQKILNW